MIFIKVVEFCLFVIHSLSSIRCFTVFIRNTIFLSMINPLACDILATTKGHWNSICEYVRHWMNFKSYILYQTLNLILCTNLLMCKILLLYLYRCSGVTLPLPELDLVVVPILCQELVCYTGMLVSEYMYIPLLKHCICLNDSLSLSEARFQIWFHLVAYDPISLVYWIVAYSSLGNPKQVWMQ